MRPPKKRILEVCVESTEGAIVAAQYADRLEISENLNIGGTTPSLELVREILSSVNIPVVVLIRGREGNFIYSEIEREKMLESIREMVTLPVAGIVAGAQLASGHLDWPFLERAQSIACEKECVVHRVFDSAKDPIESIARLSEMGYQRILTSGGPLHAIDGLETLKEWNSLKRIEILPAGGVAPENIQHLILATQVNQIHGSFRDKRHAPKLPSESILSRARRILDAC